MLATIFLTQWILVQHVTKFVLRRNSCEFGVKTSYRKLGDQEMVLCPNELRSVDYIEEICCQVKKFSLS